MTEKLNYFLEKNKIPNILIYGQNGSGKKTIVKNFLDKIYTCNNDKKNYILEINCGKGMGIKLIRENLKFFGKIIITKNKFKTIVLYNGDKLTVDAQCALRRCIEIFSKNTRFIIILENKNKLLKPLLSRFCEIFINNPVNYYIQRNIDLKDNNAEEILKKHSNKPIREQVEILYNNGCHIFNLMDYFNKSEDKNKHYYLAIIEVFRKNIFNEKIIMFYILFLFKMRPSYKLFNINSY